MTDSGRLTGSREPSPSSTGLGPSGFDPERGDAEMLAILLWDWFGPHKPRWRFPFNSPKASDEQVARYRECANSIAESLRFYRNIEFDRAEADNG